MADFAFMPIATNAKTRARVEPGQYRATCTAVQPPAMYNAFARWYMRVDFAIHDDGSLVSKYINLGNGETPNINPTPRSDYYKLWTLAAGRAPELGEAMDPARIINAEMLVTVVDKMSRDSGLYSVVEKCSSVALLLGNSMSQELSCSVAQDAQLLRHSTAPSLNSSVAQELTCSSAQSLSHSGSSTTHVRDTGEGHSGRQSISGSAADTPPATGQKPGTGVPGLTAAGPSRNSHSIPQILAKDWKLTPEQEAEIDKYPVRSLDRLAAIREFTNAA